MVFKNYSSIFLLFCIFSFSLFSPSLITRAETVDELNKQIDSYADRIKAIDKEIEEQRKLILTTAGKATEIQAQINSLNATRNKLSKDITRTQTVIKQSELNIQKLDIEISDKQTKVDHVQKGLAESMRDLDKQSDVSLFEFVFHSESMSEFLSHILDLQKFKETLINKKHELLNTNRELSEKKSTEQKTKEEFEKEKLILAGQQETILTTQKAKNNLLAVTKGEQSLYEKTLKQKQAEQAQFEALVRDIESKIKILIDPKSYPAAAKSIISWPLDSIIITQQFGGSDFAKNNPGIYGRAYHPGTDFGVPIGTKVKSVQSGTVRDFGNTDAYPSCRAWGKWILIDHDNGLSSLYAHLSSIVVSKGQKMTQGEIIALSGNTGVTTGPHLHLTLYASQGVKVGRYGVYKPGGAGCAATDATGPFADLNAYLDPMSYLPSL
jgi:murein DD-endopeptidase MepM/ murein hydrolase activator NlpD